MIVTHEVNLLNGVREEDRHLPEGRYRVYWTHLPGSTFKSFGVVDTIAMERGLSLQYRVLLDAQQSDGRAHCVRVAEAANALLATATALGFRIHADALAVTS